MSGPLASVKSSLATSSNEKTSLFGGDGNLSGVNEHKHGILEKRFFDSIFQYSHHCVKPKKIEILNQVDKDAYRPDRLIVASVSLSLNFDNSGNRISHYELVDNAPYSHLTYSDKISIEKFVELVSESINRIIEQTRVNYRSDPILILLNEFAFPFFRQDNKREKFVKKIAAISKDNKCYILCGTSHCFKTKRNVGMLFTPNGSPIEHPKFSPAINLNEHLKPNYSLNWNYYPTNLGRLGVLICFDVIDPSVLLRQIHFYADMPPENRIGIYLVPAFSKNDVVRDQCEVLSYMTKSVVIYSNFQYREEGSDVSAVTIDSPRSSSHGLFIDGDDFSNRNLNGSPYSDYVSFLPSLSTRITDDIWSYAQVYSLEFANLMERIGENRVSGFMESLLGSSAVRLKT